MPRGRFWGAKTSILEKNFFPAHGHLLKIAFFFFTFRRVRDLGSSWTLELATLDSANMPASVTLGRRRGRSQQAQRARVGMSGQVR